MKIRKLSIAILAPVTRPVSQDTRGGRPRIIYTLIEELIKRGHQATLFGSGDSKTSARVVPIVKKSLYSLPTAENPFYQQIIPISIMMEELKKQQHKFDIINNHLYPEFMPLLIRESISTPMITSIHLAITPQTSNILKYFKNEPFISPSRFQKRILRGFRRVSVIPHGIEIEKYAFSEKPKNHFLFFGRMKTYTTQSGKEVDPKGASIAVKLAAQNKGKIVMAGNCESQRYFDKYIQPYLGKTVDFVGPHVSIDGPIGFKQKIALYKNAKAMLFPLQENEAFGLTMIESMACGTPVIAFNRSTIPEIIQDGKTGFIVENEKEMRRAMKHVHAIDRRACRAWVEEKFTAERMADAYEKEYYNLLNK